MKKSNYEQVLEYIYNTSPNRSIDKQKSDYLLDRIIKLLALLGNPQDTFKSIHIAGTSGKGSTAVVLSKILGTQGFKVGLTVSPHILDIRERLQINNTLYPKSKFAKNFNEIFPFIKQVSSESAFPVSFFEMMIALVYYTFAKENVDYAVIETGLGGSLDATNTISRSDKLCLLTKIGLDHTKILGSTLDEIAEQKAGIIHDGNTVITYDQDRKALDVFKDVCKKSDAELVQIKSGETFTVLGNSRFNYKYSDFNLTNVELGLKGDYQIENTALALTALKVLADRDGFNINMQKLTNSIKEAKHKGRFEIFKIKDTKIIVDGAHSPQKMDAFIQSLVSMHPGQKFDFYLAFKEDKDYKEMLKTILPHASRVFTSDYIIKDVDVRVVSVPSKVLKDAIEKTGFSNVKTIKINDVLLSILKTKSTAVITGSLYFISELYLKNADFRNKD